jgi:hypothetical protein
MKPLHFSRKRMRDVADMTLIESHQDWAQTSSLSVPELNLILQRALNPPRSAEAAVEKYGWRFHVRDKVIQTENNYAKEVFNGDIGAVEASTLWNRRSQSGLINGRSSTTLANSMRSRSPMRSPFTKPRDPSSRQS